MSKLEAGGESKSKGPKWCFPTSLLVIPVKREAGVQPDCAAPPLLMRSLPGCWLCQSAPRISSWNWEVFPFITTHTQLGSFDFDTSILWPKVVLRFLAQLHYMFCSSTWRWGSYSVLVKLRHTLIVSCLQSKWMTECEGQLEGQSTSYSLEFWSFAGRLRGGTADTTVLSSLE